MERLGFAAASDLARSRVAPRSHDDPRQRPSGSLNRRRAMQKSPQRGTIRHKKTFVADVPQQRSARAGRFATEAPARTSLGQPRSRQERGMTIGTEARRHGGTRKRRGFTTNDANHTNGRRKLRFLIRVIRVLRGCPSSRCLSEAPW